jgi:glutamate-1-semialdehyde 2,1-aminomutase
MTIPGHTSTGSKRPDALFGADHGVPLRMVRAAGCRLWDEHGAEYLDTVMALGSVALGYAHPQVVAAVERAVRDGTVGSLAPVIEGEVADRLCHVLPGVEAVRFLKTGAEAVAAAVRLARVATGREHVVTCGYHGWLDWCQEEAGVPAAVRGLRRAVPFGDVPALEAAIARPDPVAAVVIEPVVDAAPPAGWLEAARRIATSHGALLVFDELKTALRVTAGSMAAQSGVAPDLTVVGKALGNGLPIAAVCGGRDVMEAASRTWISSTLATEYVSLAAARAVLQVYERDPVLQHLERAGTTLFGALSRLAEQHPRLARGVCGLPQLCYLDFVSEELSSRVAREAARRGLLFKRNAYNFVSLAHGEAEIAAVTQRLGEAMEEVTRTC